MSNKTASLPKGTEISRRTIQIVTMADGCGGTYETIAGIAGDPANLLQLIRTFEQGFATTSTDRMDLASACLGFGIECGAEQSDFLTLIGDTTANCHGDGEHPIAVKARELAEMMRADEKPCVPVDVLKGAPRVGILSLVKDDA